MPDAPNEFRGQSLGSGFVLNERGFILTNNHVVKDATDIQVMLSDGRQFTAEVVGKDPLTDVALIKLRNPPKDLPTVMLGSSEGLKQGDFVLALGSPLGLRDTATLGIVSAKHRSGINPGGTYDDFIQTDAAINPGNSGGPLFNLRGEVVGINTAIVRPDVGQGIGFAVPIDLAKSILPQLEEKGKVTRGYLGVQISDLTPDLAQAFGHPPDTKGALVQNVVPGGPAAKGGVQPGDVVVSLNGKPVESSGQLTRSVALVPPGNDVNLVVVRKGGEKKPLTFKVAQRPDDETVARGEPGEGQGGKEDSANKSPKLGVSLSPITPEMARQLGVSPDQGVVVTDVVEGGPAQRAGVRQGDVVVEVGGRPVKKVEDVAGAIAKMKDGEMALLRLRRGDSTRYVAVPIGGRQ
jgi:serine protease Do